MITTHDYYRDPNVIKRIMEYCGVPNRITKEFSHDLGIRELQHSNKIRSIMYNNSTTEYLSGWGEHLKNTRGKAQTSRKPEDLGELLDYDLDLFRSIWDKENILFILDIEYMSKKFPAEPYLNQERIGDGSQKGSYDRLYYRANEPQGSGSR